MMLNDPVPCELKFHLNGSSRPCGLGGPTPDRGYPFKQVVCCLVGSDPLAKMLIVGEGLSGLVTALALRRRNPSVEVEIVRAPDRRAIEIPASTFESIRLFLHDFLECPLDEFVRRVKPVWKYSVYYKGWGVGRNFHHTFDNLMLHRHDPESGPPIFSRQYYRPGEHMTLGCSLYHSGGKTSLIRTDRGIDLYPYFAYHLEPERTARYLRDLASRRGISTTEDTIEGVQTGPEGIKRLRGASGRRFKADLYFDCTGFARVLHSEVSGEFVEYDHPPDRALFTRVPRDVEAIEPATHAIAMPAGWMWQIDTADYRSLGYVHSSQFVSLEEARAQMVAQRGDLADEDLKEIRFSTGYVAEPWCGNCVAMGNAQGFPEPLEASAVASAAFQAQSLSRLLSENGGRADPALREEFNEVVYTNWESFHDFLQIPYKYTTSFDTPFWRHMNDRELREKPRRIVDFFQEHGFVPLREMTDELLRGSKSFEPIYGVVNYLNMFGGLEVPFPGMEKLIESGGDSVPERVRSMQSRHRRVAEAALSHRRVLEHPELLEPLGPIDVRCPFEAA